MKKSAIIALSVVGGAVLATAATAIPAVIISANKNKEELEEGRVQFLKRINGAKFTSIIFSEEAPSDFEYYEGITTYSYFLSGYTAVKQTYFRKGFHGEEPNVSKTDGTKYVWDDSICESYAYSFVDSKFVGNMASEDFGSPSSSESMSLDEFKSMAFSSEYLNGSYFGADDSTKFSRTSDVSGMHHTSYLFTFSLDKNKALEYTFFGEKWSFELSSLDFRCLDTDLGYHERVSFYALGKRMDDGSGVTYRINAY